MAEPTLKKTHELLEKLVEYVMNEIPKKSEVMTKRELEKRFQQIECELERKADRKDSIIVQEELSVVKKDLPTLKENVGLILNDMDGMAKSLDDIRTEQKAFISGLRRVEKRLEVLEKKKCLKFTPWNMNDASSFIKTIKVMQHIIIVLVIVLLFHRVKVLKMPKIKTIIGDWITLGTYHFRQFRHLYSFGVLITLSTLGTVI